MNNKDTAIQKIKFLLYKSNKLHEQFLMAKNGKIT